MFKIEKRFSFPMGHRLSRHQGECVNIHGHNFDVLVGVKAKQLNSNDMVIDFKDLKEIVNYFLDMFDHSLTLNEKNDTDRRLATILQDQGFRVNLIGYEPTAERFAFAIYNYVRNHLPQGVQVDYVTVFENNDSKATYTEG